MLTRVCFQVRSRSLGGGGGSEQNLEMGPGDLGLNLLGEEYDPMTWYGISILLLPTILLGSLRLNIGLPCGGGCYRVPAMENLTEISAPASRGRNATTGQAVLCSGISTGVTFASYLPWVLGRISFATLELRFPCSFCPLTSLRSWKQPVGTQSHVTPPATQYICFLLLPLQEAP